MRNPPVFEGAVGGEEEEEARCLDDGEQQLLSMLEG